MPTTALRRRTAFVSLSAAVLAASGLLSGLAAASPASAAPGSLGLEQGLSGVALPMGQTNSDVQALAVAGGVLYAGGTFTTATSTTGGAVPRTYLAAYSSTTGALISSFNFTLDKDVQALSVSPDGTTLYLTGDFTKVNNVTHNRIAAIDLTTNTVKAWAPNLNNTGTAVTSTNTAVYVGGGFTKVNNAANSYFTALDPATGNVPNGWVGSADKRVYALAMTTDGSGLLVGGDFNDLSGMNEHGLGKVDPVTGAPQAWDPAGTLPNVPDNPPGSGNGCDSTAKDIFVSGTVAYVSGQGAQYGCYDGDEAVDTATGTPKWILYCEGGTQALAVVQGTLYKGSHMHDCAYEDAAHGGFTGNFDPTKRVFYHLQAQNPADGSFEHFSPVTDSVFGPLAMATDGTQLFVGGVFTKINKVTQGHITRFGPKVTSSDAAPTKPTAPTAVASGSGTITVTWPATTDIDNGTLTYKLYRSSTLVATTTAESWPWTQPTMRFVDTRPAGTSAKYTVTASDGVNTTAKSPASAAVVANGTALDYDATVSGLSPALNWKLDGNAGDSSANAVAGGFNGGVTTGAADDRGGSNAITVDGSSGYVSSAAGQGVSPSFSETAWFKTTTGVGGDIVGLKSDAGSGSATTQRAIWMENDGQVVFGIQATPGFFFAAKTNVVRTPRSYNDGHWHQVTSTYDSSSTTLTLYVDGANVGTSVQQGGENPVPTSGSYQAGYTDLTVLNQVFGFNTTGETSPTSYYFGGSLDDVSFYNTALTSAQVGSLWAANASHAP